MTGTIHTHERQPLSNLHLLAATTERPFYWSDHDANAARPGWYQWTGDGLRYLGSSILE